MKFAKELEQDLVPEWRVKYLDYKAGKKHIKAVSRAVNRMNDTPTPKTPRTPARPGLFPNRSLYGATSPFTPRTKAAAVGRYNGNDDQRSSLRNTPAALGIDSRPESDNSNSEEDRTGPLIKTPPRAIPMRRAPVDDTGAGNYGSFVATPPERGHFNFELPGPAMEGVSPVQSRIGHVNPNPMSRVQPQNENSRPGPRRSASMAVHPSAYEIGQTLSPGLKRNDTFASLRHRMSRGNVMQRMFSVGTPLTPAESNRLDVSMVAVDQVRERQRDFFAWMNKELDKIETFYKEKEDEAGARLNIIREQLHEMRNRRIEELAAVQRAKAIRKESEHAAMVFHGVNYDGHGKDDEVERPNSRDRLDAWLDPVKSVYESAKAKVTAPLPGKNSKALQNMAPSPELQSKIQAARNYHMDQNRDYVRRPHYADEVPYRTAKRKLKLAMQEFYRGMELLKSYALLNRTAFRKINKKYDKAVDAHPPLRFMSDKVNKAWFVQSDVLDGHIHAVEDLYARYFERGNHKIAVGKLRSSSGRLADRSMSAFQNGMLIGVGGVFAIQGVIYAADLLHNSPNPTIHIQTSYLLQIYAGYFLALYLFAFFCFDCSIFSRSKINYQFIFEFDPRHHLDWQQLSEFPAFLFLVMGLFVWLNFSGYGADAMYIYYPVILIFVTVVIIFIPAPILFHRSRRWFVYSHWRLLLAGLYPVEFRDFFLGDMYCSLTYMTSNIELFFCLYAQHWSDPTRCNSTHSRLLGFFSTLPGIWRFLQCLRRYYDTGNVFPHLVNGGKYLATILYYLTLSTYRIKQTHSMLALFVTFATINAVYVSIWDILMDWSLLQPHANKKLLRDVRGYKNPYYYYAAIILDPILRFNWIFYAIYTSDLQHSTIVAFLVGLSECTRRGIWVIFRVENEHCSNVRSFKASRDVPLPYSIPEEADDTLAQMEQPVATSTGAAISPTLSRRRTHTLTGGDQEQQNVGDGTMRRRQPPPRTFTRVLADAHTQDFEKKRKPGAGDSDSKANRERDGEDEDGDAIEVGSSDDESGDELESGEEGGALGELGREEILGVEGLLRERRGGGS